MAKRIEEIFEECLKRIEHGESIESCLASYPEESQELELMLRTFVNVKWRATLVEPSPQFKARGRAQLFNIYRQRAYQDENKVKQPGRFSLQKMLVPALAGIVIFILIGGVGTAAASNSAMPDQPLYPVKLVTEEVRLALSFSDADKVVVNTEIAQTRAQEIAAMAEIGKTEYIVVTTERMLNNLENAEQAVNKVVLSESANVSVSPSATPPEKPTTAVTANTTDNQTKQEDITNYTSFDESENAQNQRARESYETTVEKNLAVLEAALDKVPENTKSTIQNALDITRTKKERIESINRLKWQDRNNNGIPDKDEIKRPGGSSDNNTDSQTNTVIKDARSSDNITTNSDNIITPDKVDRVNNNNTSTSDNVSSTTSNITTTIPNITANTSNTTAIDNVNNDVLKDDDSSNTNLEQPTEQRIFWPWRIFRSSMKDGIKTR